MRYFYLILSFFTGLVILLPIELLFGKVKDIKFALNLEAWAYGISATLLLAFLFAYSCSFFRRFNQTIIQFDFNIFVKRLPISLIFFVCIFLLALISSLVFKVRPPQVDSIAYLFQAKIFAAGNLLAPLPKYPEFFYTYNILYEQNGVFAQYPPFHSLLLAVGVYLGSVNVVQILISILGVVTASVIYQMILPNKDAKWATLLLAISPFYLFLGVSFMSHSTAFLLIALTTLYCFKYVENKKLFYLILSGFFSGLALATRPLEMIAIGIVLLIYILKRTWHELPISHLLIASFSVLPGVCVYLGFNMITTGDPFLAGYIKLWGASHQLGFHQSPWGIDYTPLIALQDFIIDWKLINEFLFESPWPALIFLPVLFLKKQDTVEDRLFLILSFATPIAYIFYWHRDSFLGPRFLHVSILFLIPLFVRSLGLIDQHFKSKEFSLGHRVISLTVFWRGFIILTIIYSLCFSFPQRANTYAHGMASFKINLPEMLKARKVNKALVFVKVSFGHRLVSLLRGAGVSAPLVEQVYRQSDHCQLSEIIKNYYQDKLSFEQLLTVLNEFIIQKQEVLKLNIAGDSTFRLKVGNKIPAECQDDLNYDLQGFGNYSPFFADNSVGFNGNYIFATDLRDHNQKLINLHPDYPIFYLVDKQLIASS